MRDQDVKLGTTNSPSWSHSTNTAGYGYGQQGYYGAYQQQQAHAAGNGDQTATYGQQQGITQQAYVQQGYGYAHPAQQHGDQQGYSLQGFAYSQPEAAYTAVVAAAAPPSATTPAVAQS